MNSNTRQDEHESRIAEESEMWLEKLERALSQEESEPFRNWLTTAAHREAIVERCKRWHGPEVLAVLAELVPVETFREHVERHYGRMTLAIFLAVTGVSFATIVIAVSKLWPSSDVNNNPLRAEATFVTRAGERKTIELPDGGRILMNTSTKLQFKYMPQSRDVYIAYGEASFDPKYDHKRPFLVLVGGRQFQVTEDGAVFNLLRRGPDRIELTVKRGQVRVPRGQSRSSAPISPDLIRARVSQSEHTFVAGEAGLLGPDWLLTTTLRAIDVEKRLSWQRGVAIFDHELLGDVLTEMERYTLQRFRIRDDRLLALRVSGEFDITDLKPFEHYLHDHLKITLRQERQGEMTLLGARMPND
jgi:transmembrane sensor